MSLKLYSNASSSSSWRVRICLALKGIPYTHIAVDIVDKEEQHDDKFKSINPLGQVPALVDGDICICQSIAIMEYIDEKYKNVGPALFPSDLHKRAQVRQISEIIVSGIQPLQSNGTLKKVDAASRNTWASHWISKGFDALEILLSETAGRYCVGDQVTMADACLVPQCRNASVRYNFDLTQYININRINKLLLQHPAFSSSAPDKFLT